jgi:leucyl aminopeptidase (aminopeptidase T)
MSSWGLFKPPNTNAAKLQTNLKKLLNRLNEANRVAKNGGNTASLKNAIKNNFNNVNNSILRVAVTRRQYTNALRKLAQKKNYNAAANAARQQANLSQRQAEAARQAQQAATQVKQATQQAQKPPNNNSAFISNINTKNVYTSNDINRLSRILKSNSSFKNKAMNKLQNIANTYNKNQTIRQMAASKLVAFRTKK